MCRKLGLRNCKELREAKWFDWYNKGLTADELKLLGTLGSVLPALGALTLYEPAAGLNAGRQLAEGLGARALPAVTWLRIIETHVGDAGASALAAALGQGALPRLQYLTLNSAAIGDAGLVALAPALRRRRTCRRREGWRSSSRSTSATPRSQTPAAPPSPLRSTAARCRRSRSSTCLVSPPAPRRTPPCTRRVPT